MHKQCAGLAEPDCIPTKNFVKRGMSIQYVQCMCMYTLVEWSLNQ